MSTLRGQIKKNVSYYFHATTLGDKKFGLKCCLCFRCCPKLYIKEFECYFVRVSSSLSSNYVLGVSVAVPAGVRHPGPVCAGLVHCDTRQPAPCSCSQTHAQTLTHSNLWLQERVHSKPSLKFLQLHNKIDLVCCIQLNFISVHKIVSIFESLHFAVYTF